MEKQITQKYLPVTIPDFVINDVSLVNFVKLKSDSKERTILLEREKVKRKV